jgi:S-adenosylmethionine hydrolase
MPPILTLLTDFGSLDTYVGQVKGAILSVAPETVLVDLTHAVPPQDIASGAFLLATAVEAFAAGTVHLAVVDPGVGSNRRGVAIQSRRGDQLVGPDNGLLWPAVERLGGVSHAVELREPRFWRSQQASVTFHGRDIFGPVAGHLARGLDMSALGPTVTNLARLEVPRATEDHGEVLYVDTYGNLITNIPAPAEFSETELLRVGTYEAHPAPHYAAAAAGALLVIAGSAGWLEISVRDGSAAHLTGATRGAPVERVRARRDA